MQMRLFFEFGFKILNVGIFLKLQAILVKCSVPVFDTIGLTNVSNVRYCTPCMYLLLSKVHFTDIFKGQQHFTVIQIAGQDREYIRLQELKIKEQFLVHTNVILRN